MPAESSVILGDRLYVAQRQFGILPANLGFSGVSSVAVDSRDQLYVLQRSDPPVVVLDRGGEYVSSWGTGTILDGHGICVTREDEVFLVDRDGHEVLKFDVHGRLLMRLGSRDRPRRQAPFNHPTDVAVGPSGEIFVADGYGNASVHRFSADGAFQCSWGRPGSGPGEFSTPHGIWADDSGRVLVADRENDRIQLFTSDGEHIGEWGNLYHPMDIYVDREGLVYVTDQAIRLTVLSSTGSLLGRCRSAALAHGVWGDGRGNLYLAEVPADSVTRLRPGALRVGAATA
jgi:DNA-binding beta-propeller fold protein YncE